MKKTLLHILLAACMIVSCKKEKDWRKPFVGSWKVVSIYETTPSSSTLMTNVGTFTMEKDGGEGDELSMLNPLIMDRGVAENMKPFVEMRHTGCLQDLGNSTYLAYWYLGDDYRLYLNGISNNLIDHLEVCTYSWNGDELTLVFAKGEYTALGYTYKQKIVLQKQ